MTFLGAGRGVAGAAAGLLLLVGCGGAGQADAQRGSGDGGHSAGAAPTTGASRGDQASGALDTGGSGPAVDGAVSAQRCPTGKVMGEAVGTPLVFDAETSTPNVDYYSALGVICSWASPGMAEAEKAGKFGNGWDVEVDPDGVIEGAYGTLPAARKAQGLADNARSTLEGAGIKVEDWQLRDAPADLGKGAFFVFTVGSYEGTPSTSCDLWAPYDAPDASASLIDIGATVHHRRASIGETCAFTEKVARSLY